MFRYFIFKNGEAVETDSFSKNCVLSVVDPSENEIIELSEKFGVNPAKLQAATDIEEPSMWERDETGTYLIIDVPYKDENNNYDTIPLMLVICKEVIIGISEKPTGVLSKFIMKNAKYLDPEDKIGFELRFIHSVTKEYQLHLKDIDIRRRSVEKRIKEKLDSGDVTMLHDLENSLVYFITSLKGSNAILELMNHEAAIEHDAEKKGLFQVVKIENKQATEMATVYKEIVGSTRDLLSAEINLKLDFTMQMLAVITIILTIPMIITGAYGMNVDLPLQEKHYAFGIIVVITALITGILSLMFKRKQIL